MQSRGDAANPADQLRWARPLVPNAVAAALGIHEEPGRAIMALLTEHVAPRMLLLVLDNCEHLIDACARLVEELLRAGPGVRILATSREALRTDGEVTWRVPPRWRCPSLAVGRRRAQGGRAMSGRPRRSESPGALRSVRR